MAQKVKCFGCSNFISNDVSFCPFCGADNLNYQSNDSYDDYNIGYESIYDIANDNGFDIDDDGNWVPRSDPEW